MKCDKCNFEFRLIKSKDSVEFCTCKYLRLARTNNKIHICSTTDSIVSKWFNYELQGSEDKKGRQSKKA